MSKSIYEEAIADAKKVREAAEANAKNAILESVTPKIREFIEQTILEQDEEAEEEAEDADDKNSSQSITAESVTLDETAINTLLSLLGGNDVVSELNSEPAQEALS